MFARKVSMFEVQINIQHAITRQHLKDISLSLVISGLNLLICSMLHCAPSLNFCYSGHTKNSDDDDNIQLALCSFMVLTNDHPHYHN